MFKVGSARKIMFAAALAVMGIGAGRAKAGSVVFANFLQNNPGDTPWTFTDNGASSTFAISTPENVFFVSTGGASEVLTFNGTALASLTSTVTGPAVVNGDLVSQGITGTLSFTSPSGPANVLTVNFTGAITGTLGSQSSSAGADSSIEGQAVSFASDYIAPGVSFTPSFTFSIALTQMPAMDVADDGYLASFNGSATGSFSMNEGSGATPTPLPAALWGGLGMMSALGGTGAMLKRRRK